MESITQASQLAKASAPGKYTDGYTQQEFAVFAGFDPSNHCTDDALPAYPDHRMQLRNYVLHNLVPTTSAFKSAKAQRLRNLPADCGSIGDYRRKTQAGTSDDQHLRQEVLHACDQHNEVQCKHKLNPSARLGCTVTLKQCKAMRTEFVSGKLNNAARDRTFDDAAQKHARRMFTDKDIIPRAWDDEDRGYVIQYGKDAGVKESAEDDAPWPFPDVP